MKDKLSPEYMTQLSKTVQSRIPMELKQLLKELEEYDRYVHIALRHRMCPMCGASIISTFEPFTWSKMQSFTCSSCGFKHTVDVGKEPYIPHVPGPSFGGAL